ncbi:MAG: hypothetical protein ABIS28_15620 [Caldimonas sp.]
MRRPWIGAHAAGILTLSLVAGPALGQANILANGGFESGLASWTTASFFAQGFDYGIDNVAHSGSSAFYGGAIGELGLLRQTVATQVGVRYDVDFWLASDGFLPNQLQVAVDGVPLLALDDILVQPYAARHASFVATGGSSVLQFGFRNDSGLLHLDDVRVAAIPEPAINLLMAAGLGALALLGRRRGLKGRP